MWVELLAGVVAVALIVYALTGGADFGGGVWDLLATGPRAARQREAISRAIGPIWEANHVWLILVIVLLFACFPTGFAALMTALHIPLTIMLVGIVLRGSAFVFRAYDAAGSPGQRRWSRVFAVASTVTPVMLGVCAGAIASGGIRVDPVTGAARTSALAVWPAPFPVAVGLVTLCLFAFLAAVYLTVEVEDEDLREDFRTKALQAAGMLGVLAGIALVLTRTGAPELREALAVSSSSALFHLATGAAAVTAIVALWTRRYALARAAAVAQASLILWGWLSSQYPALIPPALNFHNAAAEEPVLRAVTLALGAGMIFLGPAFYWLYRVFKLDGRPGGAP